VGDQQDRAIARRGEDIPHEILSEEAKARISADLAAGKAAVGVLARSEDGPRVGERLTELGGSTSSHDVVDEAALQAAEKDPSQ
jgi:hypothetical protein